LRDGKGGERHGSKKEGSSKEGSGKEGRKEEITTVCRGSKKLGNTQKTILYLRKLSFWVFPLFF